LVGGLAIQPDVLAVELLRRAKLKGYQGGKSALCKLVKELRPKRPRPVVRFEGLPGEFSQHDFGQVDVRFLNGRINRVHLFASRLRYSRWVQRDPGGASDTARAGAGPTTALRIAPDDLALRAPLVVGPTGYVVHDTHPDSRPPDALGSPCTLHLYRPRPHRRWTLRRRPSAKVLSR
jgi:hypothetical protein